MPMATGIQATTASLKEFNSTTSAISLQSCKIPVPHCDGTFVMVNKYIQVHMYVLYKPELGHRHTLVSSL